VFGSCPVLAVMCALRALGGATLSYDGAAPFDPRQEAVVFFGGGGRCLYFDSEPGVDDC
jgi:hypothetical protein